MWVLGDGVSRKEKRVWRDGSGGGWWDGSFVLVYLGC